MIVKRGRFEFNNVIGLKVNSNAKDWIKHMAILKAAIVANDVCSTGPIIIQGNLNQEVSEANEAILYAPIHREVELVGDNKDFFFSKRLVVEDTLKVRHTELEDDIDATEKFLELIAAKNKLRLKKPYYYVYLPVYQDYVIDIWAEIEKE